MTRLTSFTVAVSSMLITQISLVSVSVPPVNGTNVKVKSSKSYGNEQSNPTVAIDFAVGGPDHGPVQVGVVIYKA